MNKNILQVLKLEKSYDNFLALDKINMTLNPGEFVTLLGPNGAGKSTLFSILSGMLSPDKGDCFINGFSIKSNTVKALKNLGIVFQQSTIDMELSILENLFFHAKIEKEIYNELELNKLSKKIEQKVRTLSGGERRKVELIRALIHKPKVLLMDEPTVGLDPKSRKDLLLKVLKFKKKKKLTTLWATHLVDEAEKADKIIVLSKGKVLFLGEPKELCKKTNSKTLTKAYFIVTGEKYE